MLARKLLMMAAVAVTSLSLPFCQLAYAQYPTPGILSRAKTYVGPKLTEQAAKLAAQPDMTGIWQMLDPDGACGGPLFNPESAVCPPRPPSGEQTFGPLPGTKMQGIPYNAKYQKMYDAYVADALQGKARDTFAACVPYGVPRMVGASPVAFDIIQAPDVMLWYNPYGRTERRIFLDGRKHPSGEETDRAGPSYSGHSVGRWEGDTLVVETVNMINAFFDETAAPHSEKLSMVERIRLIDPKVIENEMTITDPEAFTKPWVVKRYYGRTKPLTMNGTMRTDRLLSLNDRPCVPNVKMDADGFQVMMLPQEIEEAEARARGAAAPAEQ